MHYACSANHVRCGLPRWRCILGRLSGVAVLIVFVALAVAGAPAHASLTPYALWQPQAGGNWAQMQGSGPISGTCRLRILVQTGGPLFRPFGGGRPVVINETPSYLSTRTEITEAHGTTAVTFSEGWAEGSPGSVGSRPMELRKHGGAGDQ